MHLQVDAFADHTSLCTGVPTVPPVSLDRCLLLSEYRTIYNIAISRYEMPQYID